MRFWASTYNGVSERSAASGDDSGSGSGRVSILAATVRHGAVSAEEEAGAALRVSGGTKRLHDRHTTGVAHHQVLGNRKGEPFRRSGCPLSARVMMLWRPWPLLGLTEKPGLSASRLCSLHVARHGRGAAEAAGVIPPTFGPHLTVARPELHA